MFLFACLFGCVGMLIKYVMIICKHPSQLQTFDKRGTVVTEAEREKWLSLSYCYMTEESDDPSDPDVIIVHKLPWRSQSKVLVTLCCI